MAQGGIYDHLGGGLARYATDADWLVPHFEKMLYDNAEFIGLLTLVWQETRNRSTKRGCARPSTGVAAEMLTGADQKTNRAFAASLDADSEGEEGRFYVWNARQIDAALGEEDAAFFKAHYDVAPGGNWEGLTILNRSQKPALLDEAGEARLLRARQTLLSARAERVRPGWDDKVLADWNGLMIAALVEPAWCSRRRFGSISRAMPSPSSVAICSRTGGFITAGATTSSRIPPPWTITPISPARPWRSMRRRRRCSISTRRGN